MAKDNRDFMKYWALVRYYIMKRYDLKQQDMELLFFLKSERTFTRTTLNEYNNLLMWEPYRFEKLMKRGWISVYRKRTSKERIIYCLSLKCLNMLNTAYDMLQGERIPTEIKWDKNFNPVKKLTTREKLHRNMLLRLKKEAEEESRNRKSPD